MSQRTSLARARELGRGGSGQGFFQDNLKMAVWPVEYYVAAYSTKLQIPTPRVSAKKKPRSEEKGGQGRNVWPQEAATWGKLP